MNHITEKYNNCDYLEVGFDVQHFDSVSARYKTAVCENPVGHDKEHHIYFESPQKFFSYAPNVYDVIYLHNPTEELIELAKTKLSEKGTICSSSGCCEAC